MIFFILKKNRNVLLLVPLWRTFCSVPDKRGKTNEISCALLLRLSLHFVRSESFIFYFISDFITLFVSSLFPGKCV